MGCLSRVISLLTVQLIVALTGLVISLSVWLAGRLVFFVSAALVSAIHPVRSAEGLALIWLYRALEMGLPPDATNKSYPVFHALAWVFLVINWLFSLGVFVLIVRVVFGMTN